MNLKIVINSQKSITFAVVLGMMALYHQWENPTAWVYLAIHGSYGIIWVLKSHIFPDKQWEECVSLWFAILGWLSLCLYWIAPWILTSRSVHAPGWLLAGCVSMFTFGIFFHFVADMQKYISLQLRPGELFTGGLWKFTRNPNYFGELLIYLSFAMLAMHWLPIVILLLWVFVYWLPKMVKKDHSLARYEGFDDYRKRSKLFIPFVL